MTFIPSPNFSQGRGGQKIDLIVIHIMEGTLAGTNSWFSNKTSGVSAHYGIGKKGEVVQYVKDENIAWHAGIVVRPTYKLHNPTINPNRRSIGIEHEGFVKDGEWSKEMKQASAKLIKELCEKYQIPVTRDHIVAHNEIRGDKTCPGGTKIVDELVALVKGSNANSDKSAISDKIKQATNLLEDVLKELNK